jgi:hypothetical protein
MDGGLFTLNGKPIRYPQFGVTWIDNRVCTACGFIHREQHTWTFYTPEDAMKQAVYILGRPNHTLLSVDQ